MSDRPTWIGKTLGGRYRIDDILGQGGMSAVYKAQDPNLKRVVAIKIIHGYLADDQRFVVRFEEEATAVAQLRHPNIVQVYDFNHDGDLYYMVQEFIPGESLQQRLKRLEKVGRRMPVDEVIRYIVEICSATGYAHQRGMIHRDIKPANIMISVQDQAILMDFGIVKITGGERHTATGAVVGTALYLPPELIRGETPDPRSDIYSLGVTLFEMVNGKPPFDAESAMTLMMMHLNDPPPDLRYLHPEVPEGLVAVIEKAMSKDRSDRFQSMDEMAKALKDSLSGAQIAPLSTQPETQPPPVGPATSPDTLKIERGKVEAAPIVATAASLSGGIGSEPTVGQPTINQAVASQPPASISGTLPAVDPTGMVSSPVRPGEAQSGGGGVLSPPPPNASVPSAARKPLPLLAWIGLGAVGLILVVTVIVFLTRGASGPKVDLATALDATQTALAVIVEKPVVEATATENAAAPLAATATNAPDLPTETPAPIPTLGLPPTPTFPSGVPFTFIKSIALDNRRYIVDYDTLEFKEARGSNHVHFFFNTVPPEQAGVPGEGPWYLWGGPRPFDRYQQKDRPEFATQMCILFAYPDHSIELESGNCVFLPDINAVTILADTACLAGPDPRFPVADQLKVGKVAFVNGLSPDEAWWNIVSPNDNITACWVPQPLTFFHGDLSTIQLVEPPKLESTLNPEGLFVELLKITIDDQGRYVVEYQTPSFDEQLPGTHIHFFFNTVDPADVGMTGGGNRLMFGGPSPFTGYLVSARPVEATEMCALVANPNHSVIPESGNCLPLPSP